MRETKIKEDLLQVEINRNETPLQMLRGAQKIQKKYRKFRNAEKCENLED